MPEYSFVNSAQRWRNMDNGQWVSESTVESVMRQQVTNSFAELEDLTNRMYSGSITVGQWQQSVAGVLSDVHLSQAMFAAGGRANMNPTKWGRVGGTLADEYRHLANFAQQIAAGDVSQAQALARIKQYGRASQQSYWREYAANTTGLLYWDLGVAEHCPDCLILNANSPYTVQTLPTYPAAGATQCKGNCQCNLRRQAA